MILLILAQEILNMVLPFHHVVHFYKEIYGNCDSFYVSLTVTCGTTKYKWKNTWKKPIIKMVEWNMNKTKTWTSPNLYDHPIFQACPPDWSMTVGGPSSAVPWNANYPSSLAELWDPQCLNLPWQPCVKCLSTNCIAVLSYNHLPNANRQQLLPNGRYALG